MTSKIISIGELSRLSGISTYTIRFYESAGVLKPVGRADNGHRRYQAEDVLWLEFVLRLKRTGMPLTHIRQYAILRAQGNTSLESRLTMLKLHRQSLVVMMKELYDCGNALDLKIQTYKVLINQAKAPRAIKKVSI